MNKEYQLLILGNTWTVRIEDDKILQDGEVCHGLCNSDTKMIRIAATEDMSADLFDRALMHELTHAYLKGSGLAESIDEKFEESICTLFENMANLLEFKKGAFMACKKGKKKPKK